MTERLNERALVRDGGMLRALRGVDFLEPLLPQLEHHQLREVYLGYVDYLTEREMRLYCRPDMDASQMHEVRVGFARGLPYHLVASYALPELPWSAMRTARLVLEGALDPLDVAIARRDADLNPSQIAARERARADKEPNQQNQEPQGKDPK
jgi:hypothetical protein